VDPHEPVARIAGWYPANPNNYVAADRPNSDPIDKIVIHVTQGSFAGAISWFRDPAAGVSSHYTVRSSDGFVGQSVREKDIARHAGNPGYNRTSIGIEHEGNVEDPAAFTDQMYRSSARLVGYLAFKYGIPANRQHIIGHSEVPNPNDPSRYGGLSGHRDPGLFFDWDKYMSLVRAYLANR
jgi:N-acetyl-anhydromuramyl-L-alanine amidase AmpD